GGEVGEVLGVVLVAAGALRQLREDGVLVILRPPGRHGRDAPWIASGKRGAPAAYFSQRTSPPGSRRARRIRSPYGSKAVATSVRRGNSLLAPWSRARVRSRTSSGLTSLLTPNQSRPWRSRSA